MPQFFENGSNILNSLSLSQNAAILSKVFGNNVLNPGLNPTAFSSAFTGSQLTDLALYQALLNNNLVQQPQTIFPSQDNIALLTLLLRLINKNQTVEGYWPRSQHYPTSQSTSTPTTPVTPLTPLTPFLDGFFQKDTPSRKCSTEEYSSSYGSPTLKNSNLVLCMNFWGINEIINVIILALFFGTTIVILLCWWAYWCDQWEDQRKHIFTISRISS